MDFIIPWQSHGSYASTLLGKGMKHRSCVIGGRMRSRASMWDPFCRAKKHMGFLLRQYPWPLATRLRAKKENRVQPKVPTRGFSAKKKIVWRDLSAILTRGFSSKKETMWRALKISLFQLMRYTFHSLFKQEMQCDLSQKYMPNWSKVSFISMAFHWKIVICNIIICMLI